MIRKIKRLFIREPQPQQEPAKNNVINLVLTPGECSLLLEMVKFNPPQVHHLPVIVRREIWDYYESIYSKLYAVSARKKI